ncbi:hypothetical protein [Pseudomonas lactis]|uniref:hypothetical protein n=1 Tax=Pseudomonas lactis TaxID=1615674 RepID=UPI003F81FA20
MTVNEMNTTDDPIDLPIFPATDSIPCTGMEQAIHVDSVITVQHFAAAGGLVTLANEITHAHCFALYPLEFLAALSEVRKSAASQTLERDFLRVKSDISGLFVVQI